MRRLVDGMVARSWAGVATSAAQRGAMWRRLHDRLVVGAVIERSPGDERAIGVDVTDRELLARWERSRDECAVDALIQRHAGPLLGFARKELGVDSAEDAVAEVHFVLFKKSAQLDERGDLRSWLFGCLRREIRKQLVKRARLREVAGGMDDPDAVADVAETDVAETDVAALRREEREKLAARIAELGVLEQDVIVLALAGESNQAIAAGLGLGAGHVGVLKFRAVTALRQRLAGGES